MSLAVIAFGFWIAFVVLGTSLFVNPGDIVGSLLSSFLLLASAVASSGKKINTQGEDKNGTLLELENSLLKTFSSSFATKITKEMNLEKDVATEIAEKMRLEIRHDEEIHQM